LLGSLDDAGRARNEDVEGVGVIAFAHDDAAGCLENGGAAGVLGLYCDSDGALS
jgi:hypothetical protein